MFKRNEDVEKRRRLLLLMFCRAIALTRLPRQGSGNHYRLLVKC
jgi:hypothetical protein